MTTETGWQHSMRAVKTRRRIQQGKFIVVVTMTILCLFAHQFLGRAAAETASTSQDVTRGLLGHWTFDDGSGSTARDVSGRSNHGSVMGNAKWTKGVIGGALVLDGKDDFVSIANENAFDITGNITVTAWIRVESFTKSWQAIVTKGDRAWRLHRAGSKGSVGFACSDLSRDQVGDLLGMINVADGEWHHVAGVHDGDSTLVFVDGVLDASIQSSPNISVNDYPVLIGANAQASSRLFHGLIDDVRIYDRALSIDELRELVRAGGALPTMVGNVAVEKAAPAPAPPPPSLPGEFQSIFDGETLKGWQALNMRFWSVKDGSITGQSTEQNPCTSNQFLVWQGGDVADFELKLKFRIRGNGCNSGVQFRSKMREDGLAVGYQADIYQSGAYLGGVCDELHNRDGPELLSANGSKTVIDEEGTRTRTPIDTSAVFRKWDQWNDYHIIADGHKVILRINGATASELIDHEEAHCDLQGILGLQLRSGKPMTVQFKDIYLKRIEPLEQSH